MERGAALRALQGVQVLGCASIEALGEGGVTQKVLEVVDLVLRELPPLGTLGDMISTTVMFELVSKLRRALVALLKD